MDQRESLLSYFLHSRGGVISLGSGVTLLNAFLNASMHVRRQDPEVAHLARLSCLWVFSSGQTAT